MTPTIIDRTFIYFNPFPQNYINDYYLLLSIHKNKYNPFFLKLTV